MQTSFGYGSLGESTSSSSVTWQADTWYHLAWEFRNSDQTEPGIKFYRDGELISYVERNLDWFADGDIYWANHEASSPVDAGLEGVMDEFRVSNTAFAPILCCENNYKTAYTGGEADTLLLYHFNDPDQAASIPVGYDIDTAAFAGGDGFSTDGKFGGSYLSTFAGNGETVSGTGAASLFSSSDPVKTIECWVKIDASAFDTSGNFDTPWGEMQLCRFDGAGGVNPGGLFIDVVDGTNTGNLSTTFNWSVGGVGTSASTLVTWAADTWYHLAWEFRNTGQSEAGVKFYRDGGVISLNSSASAYTWSASGDIYWANHPAADVDAGLQGLMDEFRVSNTAFDPIFCGDWGYYTADINRDCYVDMADFAELALRWMMEVESPP